MPFADLPAYVLFDVLSLSCCFPCLPLRDGRTTSSMRRRVPWSDLAPAEQKRSLGSYIACRLFLKSWLLVPNLKWEVDEIAKARGMLRNSQSWWAVAEYCWRAQDVYCYSELGVRHNYGGSKWKGGFSIASIDIQ